MKCIIKLFLLFNLITLLFSCSRFECSDCINNLESIKDSVFLYKDGDSIFFSCDTFVKKYIISIKYSPPDKQICGNDKGHESYCGGSLSMQFDRFSFAINQDGNNSGNLSYEEYYNTGTIDYFYRVKETIEYNYHDKYYLCKHYFINDTNNLFNISYHSDYIISMDRRLFQYTIKLKNEKQIWNLK